jgi:hypothetical protein
MPLSAEGPERYQAAFTAAREALSAGLGLDETLAQVDRSGSFAGTMRGRMVHMLDELGMGAAGHPLDGSGVRGS